MALCFQQLAVQVHQHPELARRLPVCGGLSQLQAALLERLVMLAAAVPVRLGATVETVETTVAAVAAGAGMVAHRMAVAAVFSMEEMAPYIQVVVAEVVPAQVAMACTAPLTITEEAVEDLLAGLAVITTTALRRSSSSPQAAESVVLVICWPLPTDVWSGVAAGVALSFYPVVAVVQVVVAVGVEAPAVSVAVVVAM